MGSEYKKGHQHEKRITRYYEALFVNQHEPFGIVCHQNAQICLQCGDHLGELAERFVQILLCLYLFFRIQVGIYCHHLAAELSQKDGKDKR